MNELLSAYLEVNCPLGFIIHTRDNTRHRIVGILISSNKDAFMLDDLFGDTIIFSFDSITSIKIVDFETDYEEDEDSFLLEVSHWIQEV